MSDRRCPYCLDLPADHGIPPLPPDDIRYVVTLDADTEIAARHRPPVDRQDGASAQPAAFRRRGGQGCRGLRGPAAAGHAVAAGGPGRLAVPAHLLKSSGIDPYAAAVSDVYQDLFGEGSYAGKGIYDVDAFESALAGRVPDSTLLSHDLFEGIFARAGLASDVEVVEEFPSRYDVGAVRLHRWARGDWQLLPWILGRGPKARAGQAFRAIPAIGRWKMLDNLRRTLSAPAAILALFAAWTMPIPAALVWTVFVLATIVLPTLIPVVTAIPPRAPGNYLHQPCSRARRRRPPFPDPFGAYRHLPGPSGLADGRCHRADVVALAGEPQGNLLEWVTAAQSKIGAQADLVGTYRRMAGALAIGVAAAIFAICCQHGVWPLVTPFAALWLASPAVARWVSLPPRAAGELRVSDADTLFLRLTARRTWRFFEAFVTPVDHMLPPDNFQEDPAAVLAHRTSPTNIGLYLLSVASARDFGWIGTSEAIGRLEATFARMADMASSRGIFTTGTTREICVHSIPVYFHRR